MSYLFAAYSIIWLVIAGYIWVLAKRQKDAVKELSQLQEMDNDR